MRNDRLRDPTYLSWKGMKARCNNPNNPKYHRYGGRGIRVCDSWRVFENFLEDMGPRPTGMTLDRVNNEGNYEPGNCKWSTRSEQALNRNPPRKYRWNPKYLSKH